MANKVAYHSVVIDANGTGTQATITVYDAGTTDESTIYSTPAGAAEDNPFTTDSYGRFVFYADPGEYDIQVSGSELTTYTLEDVSITGVSEEFVRSNPPAGDRRVKKVRLDSDDKLVIVYDETPES